MRIGSVCGVDAEQCCPSEMDVVKSLRTETVMQPTVCERVAAPLLTLHRKTTSPIAVVVLGVVALGIVGYGLAGANHHMAWFGALLAIVSWYGFLLSGCERLLAARDRQIAELRSRAQEKAEPGVGVDSR